METYSYIKLLSILNPSEVNGDLFIKGYNILLLSDDTRAARDFYLLLMVYVNYFCVPILFFALKGLSGFGQSVLSKYSERSKFVHLTITFFVEDKKYISMLPFLWKKHVECNLLLKNTYCKTVLL
ncbi:MAG: hypothetical protein K8F52_01645 [Candidatus Scalindua rubra]|uniref:Uncharacterized protein n=1 Tax=Candidatus Scalindua brodae TaxID=237368 RepID=A0A0B0ELT9_9BACT|nr:MAG: hypothetical protein SCABRO_02149 [Candidatus Scalindua brodae]MBZ0107345.1 hypothetical protein [Candidatus Scalindua rubra]TWU31457.1 hypothetical protein S225a_21290 [Candidatus Brocadiaceae bacterium S225]